MATQPQMINGQPNHEISDEDLLAKLERVRPVVRFDIDYEKLSTPTATKQSSTGMTFFIMHGCEGKDLLGWCRRIAYTWSPKAAERADQREIDGKWHRLKQVGYMTTFHKYGAPSFFKPSVAEVLAQLPWETIREHNLAAFEIESEGLSCVNCVTIEGVGYHRVNTILYAYKPQEDY